MADFITPTGVITFPTLSTPRPRTEGGEPVYSISLLFGSDVQKTAAYKNMVDIVNAVVKEKWGATKVPLSSIMLPFRDAKEKEGIYQGYAAGIIYVSPWTKQKPGVLGPDREEIFDLSDVWSGQLARANVTPFAWERSGKRGVSLGLNGVQIMKLDCERIDGRKTTTQMFNDDEEAF